MSFDTPLSTRTQEGRARTPADRSQFVGTRAVAVWLFAVAAFVFAMVLVGGLTRLTDSGLSITEWRPVTGAIPPMSEAAWEAELEKYRQIPEYQFQNKGMSLDDFKTIYWWEWGHRLLGRLIGVAFFFPFVFFWATGQIGRRLVPRLLGLFVLGGLQGVLGWYMVMSGLTERLDVSQYRLVAHLGLAIVIYLALVWTGFCVWTGRLGAQADGRGRGSGVALALLAFVYLQILSGGFVAGTDAGYIYNTWPLMLGTWVPPGLWEMDPWWLNATENVLTIQFLHRCSAYLLLAAVLANWVVLWRSGADRAAGSAALLLAVVVAQAGIGIWTLLEVVPIALGGMHQAGALIVLSAALWHVWRRQTPVSL